MKFVTDGQQGVGLREGVLSCPSMTPRLISGYL